jgi:hypothetical protein
MIAFVTAFAQRVWVFFFGTKQKRKPSTQRQMRFDTGAHYYLADLLDRLNDYIEVAKRLKRGHPEIYDYYRRVGCAIGSSDLLFSTEIGAHWRMSEHRPSLAMCHYCVKDSDAEKDHIYPVFSAAQKLHFVPGVEFSNHEIYQVVMIYRDTIIDKYNKEYGKLITAPRFYVAVDDDGECHILRVLEKHFERKDIPVSRWVVPGVLKSFAKEKGIPARQIAQRIFTQTINLSEKTDYGLLVRARKGGVCAAFAIDMLRTPYFFKDRQKTVNVRGRTKRIFHIVRTHQRKSGSIVKTHFRGLRRFTWAGHDVTVSMPGLHHASALDFTVAGYDSQDERVNDEDFLTMDDVGRVMDRHMNQ